MGFYMLILLAGSSGDPGGFVRGRQDGRDQTRRAPSGGSRCPLVMPTLTVVLVLSLIRSFQIFDEVYLLTGGGPGRETYHDRPEHL